MTYFFIRCRILSNDSTSCDLFRLVTCISLSFDIIIILYKAFCDNLSQYVNIESGTSFLRNYTYFNLSNQLTTPPSITDYDSFQTDVVLLRVVGPDDTKNLYNPSSRDFIQNYGVQFISNRFYIKDSNLTFYEQIFSKYMTAFVPFAIMISDMSS